MKHTLEPLLALAETDEGQQQIRVVVAELCGWTFYHDESETIMVSPGEDWPKGERWVGRGYKEGDGRPQCELFDFSNLPKYHTSLDAIMPEVRKLEAVARNRWINYMADIIDPMGELEWRADFAIATADPIYHCIALLLTLQA